MNPETLFSNPYPYPGCRSWVWTEFKAVASHSSYWTRPSWKKSWRLMHLQHWKWPSCGATQLGSKEWSWEKCLGGTPLTMSSPFFSIFLGRPVQPEKAHKFRQMKCRVIRNNLLKQFPGEVLGWTSEGKKVDFPGQSFLSRGKSDQTYLQLCSESSENPMMELGRYT